LFSLQAVCQGHLKTVNLIFVRKLFNILITFDRMVSYKVIKERPAQLKSVPLKRAHTLTALSPA
jgi:hypothetical protein